MPSKDEPKRMTVRFGWELYGELEAWARDENRSLHAQIIYLLRQAVAERARKKARTKTAA